MADKKKCQQNRQCFVDAIPSVLVFAVMSQRVQRVFAAWSFETVMISGFDVFVVCFNSLVFAVVATRLVSFYGVWRHVVLV